MATYSNHLMDTYARKPIAFVRGQGVWLYPDMDAEERYLDALSGLAVCGLGHAHPAVVNAVTQQAENLMHTSNLYRIALQEKLGAKLCQISGMDAAFFGNSGAEANEAAIKLARAYGHQKNIQTPAIVVMENSFHGRTMATLTATGNHQAHAGYAPLVPGFIRAPYNDVDGVDSMINENADVTAILVEPIQGEGGVRVPDFGYLAALRECCNRHEVLLMLDEVQTGNGRTGKWFCCQHEEVQPDVLITAKGLGNGVPIGACLAKKHVAELFVPGSHGSTFGGNPLACRAGLTTLETIETENLCENAARLGQYMLESLRKKFAKCRYVKAVRGRGLMIGIELAMPCAALVDLCLQHKLLINVTAERVIRLLPPLILEPAQADTIVATVVDCVHDFIRLQK